MQFAPDLEWRLVVMALSLSGMTVLGVWVGMYARRYIPSWPIMNKREEAERTISNNRSPEAA